MACKYGIILGGRMHIMVLSKIFIRPDPITLPLENKYRVSLKLADSLRPSLT